MDLFSPVRLGPSQLPNCIAMAPMTRNRCGPDFVPTELNALYYAQRASAGLLISEGTPVSRRGVFPKPTPGIYTEAQADGWRLTTDAVHVAGGHIFMQLWHCGRVSHPSVLPDGMLPMAPSAIRAEVPPRPGQGGREFVVPHALTLEEIPGVVAEFAHGAELAKKAGFDGVELHGANGYFLDQFLRDKTNRRTDRYGGSPANRARFILEVTEAVVGVWGADRVGYRISPSSLFNDMADSDPHATYNYAVKELDRFGLAYLHVIEPAAGAPIVPGTPLDAHYFRPMWRSILMVNSGYTLERANAVIGSGQADMVSFGSRFISNPDLPDRLRRVAPLADVDPTTMFSAEAHGLTDYPTLAQSAVNA